MEDAYVFNLPYRTDRWERMVKNWSAYFNLIRVEDMITIEDETIPKMKRAADGLGYSHMKLLKEAKAKGLKTILLLEDDALPEPNWIERWAEIKPYLDSHMDEWEVFNGGVHYLRDYYDVKELDSSCLINGQMACASHFIYLNLSAFDKFMRWEDEKDDIDKFYCYNFKMYCSFPMLSKQADGKSDITGGNRHWFLVYLLNEYEFKYKLDKLYFKYRK